jgi:predicted small metal-binding protein
MPSIACRDVGIDCDYFIQANDAGEVIVEDIRHGQVVHKFFMDQSAKNILAGKEKLSDSYLGMLMMMKNLDSIQATASCRDLGIACDWKTSRESVGKAFAELGVHIEQQHPEEFKKIWEEKNYGHVFDLNNAIRRHG